MSSKYSTTILVVSWKIKRHHCNQFHQGTTTTPNTNPDELQFCASFRKPDGTSDEKKKGVLVYYCCSSSLELHYRTTWKKSKMMAGNLGQKIHDVFYYVATLAKGVKWKACTAQMIEIWERERGSEKAFFSFFLRWSCMHAMPDHPSSPHAAMAAGTLMAKTATVHMISTTASCPANMEKKPLITRHSVTHASVSHYHHLLTPFLQKNHNSLYLDISMYLRT